MPPRGGAVAIVGADAMGKANDEEVRGDAEEVTQRRSEAPRRRTVATPSAAWPGPLGVISLRGTQARVLVFWGAAFSCRV